MKVRALSIVLVIVAVGTTATLVSGLFYEQNLGRLGVSKVGYGFPLSWRGNSWIIYPGMPTVYWFSFESFVLDTAFWCLIFALLTLVLFRWFSIRKGKSARENKSVLQVKPPYVP